MKLSYFYPLVGFVIPTVVIGYGIVIPRSCIACESASKFDPFRRRIVTPAGGVKVQCPQRVG